MIGLTGALTARGWLAGPFTGPMYVRYIPNFILPENASEIVLKGSTVLFPVCWSMQIIWQRVQAPWTWEWRFVDMLFFNDYYGAPIIVTKSSVPGLIPGRFRYLLNTGDIYYH